MKLIYWSVRHIIHLALLSMLCMVCLSCHGDAPEEPPDLTGKWTVQFAERNGRATELINGAVFEFIGDSLKTDWTGEWVGEHYRAESNQIYHGDVPGVKYDIVRYAPDTLVIGAKARGMDFVLYLLKEQPTKD